MEYQYPDTMFWSAPLQELDMFYIDSSTPAPDEHDRMFSEGRYRPESNTHPLAGDGVPSMQLPSLGPSDVQPTPQQTVKPCSSRTSTRPGLTRVKIPASRVPERLFRCEWRNCRYSGTFKRKAELLRHVDTTHVNPRSFKCPVERCGSTFNRKYNLKDHLGRIHKNGV